MLNQKVSISSWVHLIQQYLYDILLHIEDVADNAKQGFTVPPNASSSNEEAQPTKSQSKTSLLGGCVCVRSVY